MGKNIIAIAVCCLVLIGLAGVASAGELVKYDATSLPETTGSTVVGSGVSEFSHSTNGDGLVRTLGQEDGISYLHTDNTNYTTAPSASYYTMDEAALSGINIDFGVAYTIECRLRINNYQRFIPNDPNTAKIFFLRFNEPDSDNVVSSRTEGTYGKDPGGIQEFAIEIASDGKVYAKLAGQPDYDPENPNATCQPIEITDPENWHTYTMKVWPWNGLQKLDYDAPYPWPLIPMNDDRTTSLYVDSVRSGSSTYSAVTVSPGESLEFGNYNSGDAGDPNTALVDYDLDWVKITSLNTAEPVDGATAAWEGGPNDEMLGTFGAPSLIGAPDTCDPYDRVGAEGSFHLSDGTTTAMMEIWSWSGYRTKWYDDSMVYDNGAWYQHIAMSGATEPAVGTNRYFTTYNHRYAEYNRADADEAFAKYFGNIDVDHPYAVEWRFRFDRMVHKASSNPDDYYGASYWSLAIKEPGDHYARREGEGNPDYGLTGHYWILGIQETYDENGDPAKVMKFSRGYGSWYSGMSDGTGYTPFVNEETTPLEGGFVIEPNVWYDCKVVVTARPSANEDRTALLYVNGKYICGGNWEDAEWFHANNEDIPNLTYFEFGNFSAVDEKSTIVDWDLDYMRTGLYAHTDCENESGILASYSGGVNLPFTVADAYDNVVDPEQRSNAKKDMIEFLDADAVCTYQGNTFDFARHWAGSSAQDIDEYMAFDNEGMDNEVDYFHCNAMDTNHVGDNLYYSIDDVSSVLPDAAIENGYTIGWRMRVNDYVFNDPSNAGIFSLAINEPDGLGDDLGGVWTASLYYDNTTGGLKAHIATSGWGDGAVIDNDWHDYKLKVYNDRSGNRMARLYVDGEAVYASVNGTTGVFGESISFGNPGVTSGSETGSNYDLDYIKVWIDGVPTDCSGAKELGYLKGDINGDCKVDLQDLQDMAGQWLDCIDPGVSGCDTPWSMPL